MGRAERRLTALVAALTFADLLLWFAIVPLIPMWERDLGITRTEAGLILGAYSASILLLSFPAGHLADRVGPKRLTVIATFVFAPTIPLLAVADSVPTLIGVRLVQGGVSAVAWSAGLAWLATSVATEVRPRAIAIVNGSGTVAGLAGPLLGGPVVAAVGLTATFSTVGALVLVLAFLAWAEPLHGAKHAEGEGVGFRDALRAGRDEPRVRVANAGIFLVGAVISTVQALAPLHLADDGVSDSTIGWIFAASACVAAAVTITVGAVAGRIDALVWTVRVIGLVVVATLPFVLPLPLGLYIAAVVSLGAVQASTFALSYPLAALGAEKAAMGVGVAMASLSVAWGLSALIAPVAGGAIADRAGDQVAFAILLVAGALTFVAARATAGARAGAGTR